MKILTRLVVVFVMLWFSACSDQTERDALGTAAPWVKVIPVHLDDPSAVKLSGTVRARYETPVAFQLSGRIASRHVDAGQQVEKGQMLFRLDTRDLKQAILSAEAERAAAYAELMTVQADIARDRKLVDENFISQRAMARTELAEQEARARLNAAQAWLKQARNALGYADLRAESAGVLIEVSGEPGEVVNFGQPIAILAHQGEREIEVFFPEDSEPRQTGSVYLKSGDVSALKLREAAGAADTASRTWRARYRVVDLTHELSLGQVVRTLFRETDTTPYSFKVPLGALDERGEGVRIWQLRNNQVYPVSVQIIALDIEYAWVTAELPDNSQIIALGTHLLEPGMAVQALAQ